MPKGKRTREDDDDPYTIWIGVAVCDIRAGMRSADRETPGILETVVLPSYPAYPPKIEISYRGLFSQHPIAPKDAKKGYTRRDILDSLVALYEQCWRTRPGTAKQLERSRRMKISKIVYYPVDSLWRLEIMH